MKRGIITNNEHGIHISDGEVWMTAWEIADLFYTTVGAINSHIKAILKANILKEYEVCRCIRLEHTALLLALHESVVRILRMFSAQTHTQNIKCTIHCG